MKKIIKSLLEIIALIGIIAIKMFMSGFVIMILWNLIIVPTLEVASLKLIGGIGLFFIIEYLIMKPTSINKDEDISLKKSLVNLYQLSIFNCSALLFGCIISLFI